MTEHKWKINYYSYIGRAIIECECGRKFEGENEEVVQKYFFSHLKEQHSNKGA